MTEQTIPAEKVRELKAKYEYDTSGNPERLLDDLLHDLDALLPVQQPATGLLGRWAKHEEYGDVVCMWDRPDPEGKMHVRWVDESFPLATGRYYVPLSDLTFPEQATKPEEVPAGEAWLVDVEYSEESHKSIVALKDSFDFWRTSDDVTACNYWQDEEVTLIAPLTPERPGTDLQARYDELDKSWCYLDGKYSTLREDYDALDAKYREARKKIKTLEQPSPVWRIEHDWRNIKAGEYVIDSDDDTGTVTELDGHGYRNTDGKAYGYPFRAPFIVFPSKDAATPEAIEEAMKERDKETGE